MAVDIHRLIAAISPEVYCAPASRKEVRKVLSAGVNTGDRIAYLKAAAIAVPREANSMDLHILEQTSPFEQPGQRGPI